MPSVRNPQLYSVLKPRKSRTRSGCLACRARRKKCDEQKPICQNCDRLHLDCSWPESTSNGGPAEYSSAVLDPNVRDTLRVTMAPETRNGSQAVSMTDKDDLEETDPTEGSLTATREHDAFPHTAEVLNKIREFEQPETALLFDHFCHKTAPWLLNGDPYDNPILRHIVPLATKDTLVLHTILVLSGLHLYHSMPSIASVTMRYYSSALHSLKQRLSSWMNDPNQDYKPLFATIVLLCHCEFTQGNTHGAALQHLRACREFVDAALKHLHEPEHEDLVVLLVEHYGYAVLITNMRSLLQEDNIRLGLDVSTSVIPLIRNCSSFGSVFAFEPEGISLIPQIAQLAWMRKQDSFPTDDPLHQATYDELLIRIYREQEVVGESGNGQSVDLGSRSDHQLVLAIKLNAILIFLHTSFFEHDRNSPWITVLIEPLVNRTLVLLEYVEETDACYGLFWSIVIHGSYTKRQDEREMIMRKLQINKSNMPMFERGMDLLQWLWDDNDDLSFGFPGLERIAATHGINLCVS